MGHAEVLFGITYIEAGSQKAGRNRSFKLLGLLVSNVQYGRHFVPVFGVETSGREVDAFHHVAVDDAQSFLLSGTDEHGTVNFHSIDIHTVFIKASAPYVILRTQLIVRADSRLCSHQFLYGISGSGGQPFQVFGIQMLRGIHLPPYFLYRYFTHVDALGLQGDVEPQAAFGTDQCFFLGYVTYHAERHGHRVGSGEFQLVTPLQVCGSTCGLAIDFYYGKKYRVLFIVDDPSRQFYFVLGGNVQGHKGQQEKAEYGFEKSCLHFVVCLLTLFK